MAGHAFGAHAGELIVDVAIAARPREVAAAQRKLGAIMIAAHQVPNVGTMTVGAIQLRAAAVRIAVAGATVGIEPRCALYIVALRAFDCSMATVERKQRLVVIERRHWSVQPKRGEQVLPHHPELEALDGRRGQARDVRLVLKGEHRAVTCARCHDSGQFVGTPKLPRRRAPSDARMSHSRITVLLTLMVAGRAFGYGAGRD